MYISFIVKFKIKIMSIIVFSENRTGKIKKHSLDAVAYAVNISKSTSQPVIALSIGNVSNDELAVLAKYGASKIISVNKENWLSFLCYVPILLILMALMSQSPIS